MKKTFASALVWFLVEKTYTIIFHTRFNQLNVITNFHRRYCVSKELVYMALRFAQYHLSMILYRSYCLIKFLSKYEVKWNNTFLGVLQNHFLWVFIFQVILQRFRGTHVNLLTVVRTEKTLGKYHVWINRRIAWNLLILAYKKYIRFKITCCHVIPLYYIPLM